MCRPWAGRFVHFPDTIERIHIMKRFTICIAAVCLLLTLFAPAAFAAETEGEDGADNRCGENLSWTLDGSTLTISGSGNMDDFPDGAPWADSRESIHTVILSGGVTSVGAGAFTGYQNLTAVDFGSSLKEIGEKAFQSCEGLTKISLPASFRRFGPSCFEGCTNLTEVYCDGGMPSFNANCLWNGGTITIYCPVNNVWPEQYVEELETNFHGRLQVLTADGSDPFRFDTETRAPAESTAAPTTKPTTEPTTVPTTVPTTAPTTAPTTEATETPTTQATEVHTLPTPEPEADSGKSPVMGILIGVLIVSGTLSLLLIGLLIYRSRRDGDYED